MLYLSIKTFIYPHGVNLLINFFKKKSLLFVFLVYYYNYFIIIIMMTSEMLVYIVFVNVRLVFSPYVYVYKILIC